MNIRAVIFLLCSLLALPVRGDIFLELPQAQVKQGSLVTGKLKFDLSSLAPDEVPKLRGQTLGGVLYVHQIGPLIGRSGGSVYEAEAKLVFVKVPPETSVPAAGGILRWGTLTVIPSDAPREFIYSEFSIPVRRNFLPWLGIVPLAALVSFLFLVGRRRYRRRRAEKLRRRQLKEKLLSAADFDGVVELWRSKRSYLEEFPHITDPFRELEVVLFKHQFRPSQTDAERSEVFRAYQQFTEAVKGGFDGV